MRIRLIGRIALVATMVVGLACSASARTITVTENKTDGVTTSFDLTFSTDANSHSLWMAYGKTDGGDDFGKWANVECLGDVAGNVTSMANVPVPAGWGTTVYRIRFLLYAADAVPAAATLDYIEATGTQHVMTDYKPTSASIVEMSFAFGSDPEHWHDQQYFFCARPGQNTSPYFTVIWSATAAGSNFKDKWFRHYEAVKNLSSSTMSPDADLHTLHYASGELTVDGTVFVAAPAASAFAVNQPLSIFAANNSGTYSDSGNGKFKLYSFKAWNASTLALDLVPCRKTDGTVCLYDKVNHGFLVNAGTGSFNAGSQTAEPSVPETSDLVTVSLPGWIASNGDYYPYVYPLYVADISSSNSIDNVTFQKIEEGQTSPSESVSYATFVGSPRTGTIIKRGGGTLTFDQDLSSFTGPVHVENGVAIGVCSNCFGYTVKDNAGVNQRTYVHSGATLVMDDIENKMRFHEWNAAYYEGVGYPGLGGAFVVRNGDENTGTDNEVSSWWQPGSGSTAVGAARLFVDIPTGSRVQIGKVGSKVGSDFNANGQDVLICGREAGSELRVYDTEIKNIGNLVISNMTLSLQSSGRVQPKNGNTSSIRFNGGARWNVGSTHADGLIGTATLYVDDMEYACIGYFGEGHGVNPYSGNIATNNYNKICGPAVLNGDFRMYNAHTWVARGITFADKVSGTGGFCPWIDANGIAHGGSLRLNLLYPTNTFEGGIVMDGGSLGVYGERSVPSQDGAGIVSITNGYVYFGRKVASAAVTNDRVNFTMPVTEFVGNGAITNGTGTFQGLVKKGDGTLDYNSQMGGAYLDLQGGTVKFNTQYREEYTNDNKPEGYEPALPVFTTLKGTAGTLDLADAGGSYTVANIEGSPSVTNGNLTVTGAWTLDAATLGEKPVVVDGTLSFGEDATMSISGDIDSVARGGGFLIARADSITGLPQLNCKGWSLVASGDELRLTKPGFIIIVR